jgi:hypothetical protein
VEIHTYNPSTKEVEAENYKSEVSLGYIMK